MIDPPPWPDPYAVLGVTRDATHIEIARAYRALARRHHPDTRAATGATQTATDNARWRQILAAYTVVGDPGRPADYDRRTPPPSPPNQPRRVPVHSDPVRDQPRLWAGPVLWQPSPRNRRPPHTSDFDVRPQRFRHSPPPRPRGGHPP